jgi:hypothetical protein
VHFEWGTSTAYGNVTPDQAVGAGTTSLPFTADLSGLTPGTTVHYRAIATNALGTSRGDDKQLVTASPPQTLTVTVKGKGKVTSTPAGISCPTHCSAPFDSGTAPVLKPKPSKGWHFLKWKGACTGKKGCAPSMTKAQSVIAMFAKNP